ncbi:MAG: hypothetical protein EZS28_052117, partial [Streblomastix strix]
MRVDGDEKEVYYHQQERVQNRRIDTLKKMQISGDYKMDLDILRKACIELKIWPTIDGF